ncbi:haloacid dehalogenase type II [Pseudokineococcus basanitobsidens]|uniref:Haloacid dehalogenase type II n=1 Tax=Pseudokineococcus basanitobsidens TaxID=1926649 RepID=A0ABU8RLJ5_9ACTN
MPALADVDLVLLDVNETLSDTAPLADALADAGAPRSLAATWFSGVLRDGFALTVAGAAAPFARVAEGGLRSLLAGLEVDDADAVVEAGMSALRSSPPHPDVAPGLRALAASGLRLATLSNGGPQVADDLLRRAGVRDVVERLLSVEDGPAGAWKPAASAYRHALGSCDVAPGRALLVAVHPWDVDGAARAGLRTAWLDRARTRAFPTHLTPADLVASSLVDLATQLRR